MRICPSCSESWPEDRFNNRHPDCFRCRAGSLSVAFAGGRSQFHDQTHKEYVTQVKTEAKRNGYDVVPVGRGTFYGGVK
jgi:hypothetical protein